MRTSEGDMSTTLPVKPLQPDGKPVTGSSNGQQSILYQLLNVRKQRVAESISSSSSSGMFEGQADEEMQVTGSDVRDSSRLRSDSLGSAVCITLNVISRASSGGSLNSSNGHVDRDPETWNQSEELVESARSRLVGLSTNGDSGLSVSDIDSRSFSQPGTPPSPLPPYVEQKRKYSMGSRLAQLMQQSHFGDVYAPVDLSCKRLRYSGSESAMPGEFDDSNHSILRSVLSQQVKPPGERRNTLSVCGTRGLLVARRRHVTLSKKVYFPVSARIAEQLKRTVKFAQSLPEFTALSTGDQLALLSSACPRLLLLYMAEVNLQFAVTSMHESGSVPTTMSEYCERVPTTSLETTDASSGAERPTMQFVENTQNFIRKCQSLQIQQNEYFYMRMITLFHAGSAGILEQPDVVERLGNEARQDLQKLAQHCRPSERMRYSALLLALHTLYGVNCGMLASLFCHHQLNIGNTSNNSIGRGDFFAEYVRKELLCTAVPTMSIDD